MVGVLDDVLARGHLHHHARDAGIHGPLYVVHHAARESEDLRAKIPLDDLLDRRCVVWRHHGHAGLNSVDSSFGQALGNAYLVFLCESDACLLLAVSQGDIVDLDLVWEVEIGPNLIGEVPGAHKPVFGFPLLISHDEILLRVIPSAE